MNTTTDVIVGTGLGRFGAKKRADEMAPMLSTQCGLEVAEEAGTILFVESVGVGSGLMSQGHHVAKSFGMFLKSAHQLKYLFFRGSNSAWECLGIFVQGFPVGDRSLTNWRIEFETGDRDEDMMICVLGIAFRARK